MDKIQHRIASLKQKLKISGDRPECQIVKRLWPIASGLARHHIIEGKEILIPLFNDLLDQFLPTLVKMLRDLP